MRVLHLGKFYPPFAGGIEVFLADLLTALHNDIAVAALVHQHPAPADACPAGRAGQPDFPVYRVPCYGSLLYAPLSPGFPLWLARVIDTFRPQLLHLHMPNTSAFWALFSARARRLPWVVHWHSDVVAAHNDRRLAAAYAVYRPFEQRLLARSQAVVVTSPPYLEVSDALRPWRSKCRVIPLGLDPQRAQQPSAAEADRAERRWRPGAFRVLAVGRLAHYKGHEVLLRAMREAQTGGAQLIVVGAGERRRRLETLVDTLALRARVGLPGLLPEPELRALLASCDVLCLPSLERSEAFGLVLLEAMCFAKPVIASDIPGSGVGWVVARGGHGLLTVPGDPHALAQAIGRLMNAPNRRSQYGRRGAEALRQAFHINRVAAQLLALYRDLRPDR